MTDYTKLPANDEKVNPDKEPSKPCDRCSGIGWLGSPADGAFECAFCNGTGKAPHG